MEKEFEFGLVLGRFQGFHKGHKEIIDVSRKLCKNTLILIGSGQESGTLRNPFGVEIRKKMLTSIYYQDDVIIDCLDDLTNENDISFEWGRYILNYIEKVYQRKPDLMVYGKDESRKGWFSKEDEKMFSEMLVARNKLEISATKLRGFLIQNRREEWKKFVPEEIWEMYDILREKLLNLDCYNN
mgnify:CR=1 FL=1